MNDLLSFKAPGVQRNNIQIARALPSCMNVVNCLGVPLLLTLGAHARGLTSSGTPKQSARMREGYGSRPVCLSVCLSVPALAASASVETRNQRCPLVSLRLFLARRGLR